MTDPCRHQRTSPGDIWPPTCVEVRGHTGPHRSKAEFTTDGKRHQEMWANGEQEDVA